MMVGLTLIIGRLGSIASFLDAADNADVAGARPTAEPSEDHDPSSRGPTRRTDQVLSSLLAPLPFWRGMTRNAS